MQGFLSACYNSFHVANTWHIGLDFFIFIIHQNLLFTVKKRTAKGFAAIGMPMQQQ